jgi:hypothetical protein
MTVHERSLVFSSRAWSVPRAALLTGVVSFVVSGAIGCAFQQKKVEAELKHPGPVNCATATGDLRLLQSEKANVAERIVEGATSIYPAAMVVGLLAGTEKTKLQVAVGEYNKAIDNRIAEIKQTCGIQ